MVMDVSAMLVASTTLRVLAGAGSKTFCCCAGGSAANKGHGSSACTDEGNCPAYSVNSAVKVSISSCPVKEKIQKKEVSNRRMRSKQKVSANGHTR
jgi:hypothetical protein